MKADIYSAQGKKSSSIELPERIFDVAWNDALMYQVVTVMQANARTPIAHTKIRGEVRGGGKKPWQQKGTGRARHGSIRSPIWKGGGVTHGPRNDKIYARALPKKMRAKALFMALSRKLRDGRLVFVDSFGLEQPKTSTAKKALVTIGKVTGMHIEEKAKNAALVAVSDPRASTTKSFQNLANIECKSVRDLNPVVVLRHEFLVIEDPEAAVAILSQRLPDKPSEKLALKSKAKIPRAKKTASAQELEKADQ